MTTAAEQTIAPRTVNSSTSRVRRHRELRRDGLRLFTVTVPETVSENAIARGLLAAGSRQAVVSDPGLLRRAGFGRGSQLAHQWRALRVTHGQFRTHAPQQTASLFDHLVGACQ